MHPANTAPVVGAGRRSDREPAHDERVARRIRQRRRAARGQHDPASLVGRLRPGSGDVRESDLARDDRAALGTGTYVLRLSASDGELSASDEVTVVLEPANQAPQVSAGPDQRVLGLATTLAGSVTDDGKPLGSLAQLDLERRERARRGRASRTRPPPRPA